jgi:hypothetical protein
MHAIALLEFHPREIYEDEGALREARGERFSPGPAKVGLAEIALGVLGVILLVLMFGLIFWANHHMHL